MAKKLYYASYITTGHDGRDNERNTFYMLLKHIQEKAINTNTIIGGFFDKRIYTMNNGEKWLYVYNIENGVPYSLELLNK